MKVKRTKNHQNKKKVNRAAQLTEQKIIFKKSPYNKEFTKITDRLIPKMDTYADVEELFDHMNAEIRYNNDNMEMVKIF